MGARHLTAAVAAIALALPATSLGQPNRYQLDVKLAPGQVASLTVGKVPKGEFAFVLRASSDGAKKVKVTQRRVGGSAFTVINTANPQSGDVCQGAAGTLVCTDITTPATPGLKRWTFTARNNSNRPTSITLTITWRSVTSAG